MLRRELSRLESYATIVGVMVGAGVFVAIGEAGKDTGPATFLVYLLLGPVTLCTALPYAVFHSTPLGSVAGGAYVHISRTFKSHFLGFIPMWLTWLTYIGVLGVLSTSVGNYLQAFLPGANPRIVATLCLLLFYAVNLVGVKNYGRLQSAMFICLIASVALIVLPGLFALKAQHFRPFLPKGWGGLTTSMAVLFFAYAGFDALAQTAGETKSATETLPRVFVKGIVITMVIYVLIALVTFGAVPFTSLVGSTMPVADAARSYLPFGSQIAAVGALAAFLTTINACMLVPSRLLYAFAQDRVAPSALCAVNQRFGTPHVSLTVNLVLPLFLVWTQTLGYMISISLQTLIILYATECLALVFLPLVNKPLWHEVPPRLRTGWVISGGAAGFIFQALLYTTLPNPISLPLICWTVLGATLYGYERFRGRTDGFDYAKNIRTLVPSFET